MTTRSLKSLFYYCIYVLLWSIKLYTVKPVHTRMPWRQTFIPVWTGSGLERVFAFGEEQTSITCTIDMRVIIQDVSSVCLQMICTGIGGCMQIN